MKRAFLDTNVFGHCLKKNMNGHELRRILENKNYLSVIGPWAIYELASSYEENLDKMMRQFLIVLELEPSITPSRDLLYQTECNHLTNTLIFASAPHDINLEIKKLSEGIVSEKIKEMIKEREIDLNNKRTLWAPENGIEYKKSWDFKKIRDKFFENIHQDEKKLNSLKKFFKLPIFSRYTISDSHLQNFIQNMHLYPAIRALLHQHLYLNFSSGQNTTTPALNKFKDGIQIVEASTCDVFLTGDSGALTHITYLNPQLEPIHISKIIDI